uniref:Reverse transcriptase zinc-binding domain-containing protein n=1 Tax=Arundo donax TaxID=35708 RepID=A0A0A9G816_ARUDO
MKCKLFLWLAIRNRCWTADRLARRGLDHPERCPLCDQMDEDVQHLLTTCVFARQFWPRILLPLDLITVIPGRREHSFAEWWRKVIRKVQKEHKMGVNSLIIMGA